MKCVEISITPVKCVIVRQFPDEGRVIWPKRRSFVYNFPVIELFSFIIRQEVLTKLDLGYIVHRDYLPAIFTIASDVKQVICMAIPRIS